MKTSSDDGYGRKVGTAMSAVRQLHADTARLLQDCDGLMRTRGKRSLWKDPAYPVSPSAGAQGWLTDGAFRAYVRDGGWDGSVTWVLAAFMDKNDDDLGEPLLVVGKAEYRARKKQPALDVVQKWDAWFATPDWEEVQSSLGTLTVYGSEDVDEPLTAFKFIARKLCEVTDAKVLEKMIGQVDGK